MSELHIVRSLRRALAALRDAEGPTAMHDIVRALADELQAELHDVPARARGPDDLAGSATGNGVPAAA